MLQTNNIIHYCWFGGKPKPKIIIKCINSWKKYLPNYEIKEWNETNFNVNIIPYTQEAYKAKKYAFVSDYARFWILYHYGGLYFDTDVMILKPIDHILQKGPFMACEKDAANGLPPCVAPGLALFTTPKHLIYEVLLENYENEHYILPDGSYNPNTVVTYTTKVLQKFGLNSNSGIQKCEGIFIYPKEYFCPKSSDCRETRITENTVAIHLYAASWKPAKERFQRKHPRVYKIYTRLTGHIIGRILEKFRKLK